MEQKKALYFHLSFVVEDGLSVEGCWAVGVADTLCFSGMISFKEMVVMDQINERNDTR